jgi:hypothetical protein
MKKVRQSHTSNAKFGMGNSYGSGIRAKIGKIRDMYTPGINPVAPKGLKKSPKSLA